jgi:hypothetical protein
MAARVRSRRRSSRPTARPIDIGSYAADDRAFRAATGWWPRVDVDEGLRRSLEWYRPRLAEYTPAEERPHAMNATTITVPQADPGAGYRAQKEAIDAAVARALNSGWYILGKEGEAFEREFAAWLGLTRAVGCANGTDALTLALRGLGIGPGATVVTVSHTAVATVAAIEMVGATPLLLDIDPDTYTMDPDELVAVLEDPPPGLPPIRAVIPVHIYGQACDLGPMLDAARRHGVAVIEDCSQAHGATLDGRVVGTMGDVACFSLYPTKNLGALGDGGRAGTPTRSSPTGSAPSASMAGRSATSATASA